MGRLIASVTVENLLDPSKNLRCDALVDTGALHMVLPRAWRERLGDLQTFHTVDVETATQAIVSGEACGPVKIQVEGFKPIGTEAMFLDMEPRDGAYEPLVGYIPLEQSQIAATSSAKRLVPVKHLDAKNL